MTDHRDPYLARDPAPDDQPWSNATWGWVAGIAVVVLALIFAFGRSGDQVATTPPPITTGQRSLPPPPATGPTTEGPSSIQRIPAPTPEPPPPLPDAR